MMVRGTIRARNALLALLLVGISISVGPRPFLPHGRQARRGRLLSGLAQTCNSNKRKIRTTPYDEVIATRFDKIAGSALDESDESDESLSFALVFFSFFSLPAHFAARARARSSYRFDKDELRVEHPARRYRDSTESPIIGTNNVMAEQHF